MTDLKYEYHLKTWGGFYNDEYKRVHKLEPGDYWFDTNKEREDYINTLKQIEKDLNARVLMIVKTEGYNCRVSTVLHRVIRYKLKDYYSQYEMGINYPFSTAAYHMEWQWYPGFNHYPLGENFDYENEKFEIVQEWITGAFNFEEI